MQSYVDCIHCYLKQAVNCMTLAGVDEEKQFRVLVELMDDIKVMDRKRTPAENSSDVMLKVYKLINDDDPYREIKTKSNTLALKLYPGLKDYLERSGDRLQDALKISAAGNVIDLGINKSFDIDVSLKQCLESGFSLNDYDIFQKKLIGVKDVLIVGDNSGEIVFDRLLAEELSRMGKKVTYMVKGGPVLNDATMEDAVQVGMEKTAEIISSDTNYLGAILHKLSDEARSRLEKAGLVISKGQANFESLEHEELARGRVFFLLKIKCECVAKGAGAEFGDVVFFTRR